MGEVAEMMLDGTLCEGCGAYIGAAVDYPRKCRQCEKDFKPVARKKPRIKCPMCDKFVSKVGMDDHLKDRHNVKK